MSARELFHQSDKEFTESENRLYAREELVYNVTEEILIILEDKGVSKKELARRLGKSKSYVTQVLSGARNMTLATLSDICFALEIKPSVMMAQNRKLSSCQNADWTSEPANAKLAQTLSIKPRTARSYDVCRIAGSIVKTDKHTEHTLETDAGDRQ